MIIVISLKYAWAAQQEYAGSQQSLHMIETFLLKKSNMGKGYKRQRGKRNGHDGEAAGRPHR